MIKDLIKNMVKDLFNKIESGHPNWLECDECSDIMGQAKAMIDGNRGTTKELTLVHKKLRKVFEKGCKPDGATIYTKYEGEILGAIDGVFGGKWWDKLSEATQEEIHEALFRVLNIKL